jgi:hypothetical protein
MAEPKKVLRKMRGKGYRDVDQQILLWRQKMKRKDIALGKAMRKAKERAEYAKESRKTDTPDKLLKKRWF